MKSCPRCGHQNPDTARFCAQCQHRFGQSISESSPQPTPPPNVPPASPPASGRSRTVWEQGGGEPSPAPPAVVRDPRPAEVYRAPQPAAEQPPPAGRSRRERGRTVYRPEGAAEPAAPGAAAQQLPGRRIVGVLITYTWKPEGQLFPLREGRNRIGRDREQCEISIDEDAALSSRNTIITYRTSFHIMDDDSMSGTSVDQVMLEGRDSKVLSNYSTIRTGSTDWLFIAVEPDGELPER